MAEQIEKVNSILEKTKGAENKKLGKGLKEILTELADDRGAQAVFYTTKSEDKSLAATSDVILGNTETNEEESQLPDTPKDTAKLIADNVVEKDTIQAKSRVSENSTDSAKSSNETALLDKDSLVADAETKKVNLVVEKDKQEKTVANDSSKVIKTEVVRPDDFYAIKPAELKGDKYKQIATVSEPETNPAARISEKIKLEIKNIESEIDQLEAESVDYSTNAELAGNKKEKQELLDKKQEVDMQLEELRANLALQELNVELVSQAEQVSENAFDQNLLSKQEQINAGSLLSEAENIEEEAKKLRASALVVKKKDEKTQLEKEAEEKEKLASMRKKQAQNSQENAKSLQEIEKKALVTAIVKSEKNNKELSLISTDATEDKVASVEQSSDFIAYTESKKEYKRLFKEAQVLYQEGQTGRKEAETLSSKSDSLLLLSEKEADPVKKEKLIKEAKVYNQQARKQLEFADKLQDSALYKDNQAKEEVQSLVDFLTSLDSETAQNILSVDNYKSKQEKLALTQTEDSVKTITVDSTLTTIQDSTLKKEIAKDSLLADSDTKQRLKLLEPNPVESQKTSNQNQPLVVDSKSKKKTASVAEIDQMPAVINEPIFIATKPTESAYNESKPIPINPKLPDGLLYKVQVGAFRNPIPQDLFKGFAPIIGELAGEGITRYSAGLFTSFNEADFAKDEIRKIGYPDAFVVVFYNGKRISVAEARRLIAEGKISTPTTSVSSVSDLAQSLNQQDVNQSNSSGNNTQSVNNNGSINGNTAQNINQLNLQTTNNSGVAK